MSYLLALSCVSATEDYHTKKKRELDHLSRKT